MGGEKKGGMIHAERFQPLVPMDVIEDILLRLPVKSLLRFKCACKDWYYLIKSKDFISRHFHHKNNHDSLLILRNRDSDGRYILTFFTDKSSTRGEEPDYLQFPHHIESIAGPFRGIFAVVNVDLLHVALWNPATREFRPLPAPSINPSPYFKITWHDLAFGLDPNNNDFKVVGILQLFHEVTWEPYHPHVIAVYSSTTNSWRCFEDVAMVNSSMEIVKSTGGNTYMNGVYYWMTYNLERKNNILAFDMGIEVFRQIEVPNCFQSKTAELALYHDSIALLSFLYHTPIDVWLMEEEGRWTKIFTIQLSVTDERRLFGFWKEDAILVHLFSDQMTLYNLKTHEIRNLEPRGETTILAANYKDSLASVMQGLEDRGGHNSSVTFDEFFRVPTKIEENEHFMFMADLPNYLLDPPNCQCPYCQQPEE